MCVFVYICEYVCVNVCVSLCVCVDVEIFIFYMSWRFIILRHVVCHNSQHKRFLIIDSSGQKHQYNIQQPWN